jgi:signal recognition particle subunit SRP54
MKDVQVDEKQIDRVEAMIGSMTRHERTRPSVIDLSRRRRIASGAGTSHEEVGTLVKQCDAMNKISRTMGSMNSADKVKAVKELQASGGMGGMVPGFKGLPGMRTGGSSYTPSIKSKFKKRK